VSLAHPLRSLCLLLIATGALTASGAQVALTPSRDGCPSISQLAAALEASSAAVQIATDEDEGAVPVVLTSTNDSFEMSLAGATRRFSPAPASCEERARAVAVHLALALDSPILARKPLPVPDTAESETHPSSRSSSWSLEGGAVLDMARGPSFTGRGHLRGVYSGPHYGVGLSGGASTPFVWALGLANARVYRFPFELTGRIRLPMGKVELGLDAGTRLSVLSISATGERLEAASPSTRLDIAGLVSPYLQLPLQEFVGLRLTAAVAFSPRPLSFGVSPVGAIGQFPQWWFSAGLEGWLRVH
jgi:hypothetical protein